MHAVDAAIRPEIEKNDFAAQLPKTDGTSDVDPINPGGKSGALVFPGYRDKGIYFEDGKGAGPEPFSKSRIDA